MNIKVIPVMNVMLHGVGLLPFHHVTVTDGDQSKVLLVNYTFGEVISVEGMNGRVLEYESEIGQRKEEVFDCIEPFTPTMVLYLEDTTVEGMVAHIHEVLMSAKDRSKLLLVWNRGIIQDVAFYRALGLDPENHETIPEPVGLSELGLTVKHPFEEIPFSEMRKMRLDIVPPQGGSHVKQGPRSVH